MNGVPMSLVGLWLLVSSIASVLTIALLAWRLGAVRKARLQALQPVRFAPGRPTSAEDLFGYLLGANLSVLEGDNFNQLECGLPPRRIAGLLKSGWNIDTQGSWNATWSRWESELHGDSAPVDVALHTARLGQSPFNPSRLAGEVNFLLAMIESEGAGDEPGIVSTGHLQTAAWKIQHLVRLLRLGVSAGHVDHSRARQLLARLRIEARRHYGSWSDYSLSFLAIHGIVSPIDLSDIGSWRQIAQSHQDFLSMLPALSYASDWQEAPDTGIGGGEREPSGSLDPFDSWPAAQQQQQQQHTVDAPPSAMRNLLAML